ncbi:hypothetical protein FRC00_013696 [Tulasnella sp. 408]|nr:hypothetical protein FRC00_013696 [Tulasnella sp. 408]
MSDSTRRIGTPLRGSLIILKEVLGGGGNCNTSAQKETVLENGKVPSYGRGGATRPKYQTTLLVPPTPSSGQSAQDSLQVPPEAGWSHDKISSGTSDGSIITLVLNPNTPSASAPASASDAARPPEVLAFASVGDDPDHFGVVVEPVVQRGNSEYGADEPVGGQSVGCVGSAVLPVERAGGRTVYLEEEE